MDSGFFERPILNSPHEYPGRHWELDADGQPTGQTIERRREARFITPVPRPQKRKRAKGQERFVFDEGAGLSTAAQQYDPTPIIGQLRSRVDQWRTIPNPGHWGVTRLQAARADRAVPGRPGPPPGTSGRGARHPGERGPHAPARPARADGAPEHPGAQRRGPSLLSREAGDDDEDDLKGDDRKEAERNRDAARLWISGLEAVNRKLGLARVIDLSATPFFLRGSGYAEGTLFPWTMSDFSLMDAIESGLALHQALRTSPSQPCHRMCLRLISHPPRQRAALLTPPGRPGLSPDG